MSHGDNNLYMWKMKKNVRLVFGGCTSCNGGEIARSSISDDGTSIPNFDHFFGNTGGRPLWFQGKEVTLEIQQFSNQSGRKLVQRWWKDAVNSLPPTFHLPSVQNACVCL